MPEVQAHGFTWESELRTKVYGASEEELAKHTYTAKVDLPATLNRLDHCDLSIKTTCTPNTVCMADCLRTFDAVSSDTPFHMVCITYKQCDTTKSKVLKHIVEVDLTNSRPQLFGSLTRADIEELDTLVKSVPQKRKPTPEEHARMYTLQKNLQARSGAIYLNIKCNSTQSRLQCSFNAFQTFIRENPTRVIAESDTHMFRGGAITPELASARRVFKKKATPPQPTAPQ